MFILETNALPMPIREKFRTAKVTIQDRDDGSVVLLPLRDVSEYKGMMKGSGFTTEKLLEFRREEKALEDRGFNK